VKRGRLRVLLGAAPGVGKTYAMLEEGARLKAEGRDVVVAVVETHGRAATAALLDGQEVVPRRAVRHRGVELDEMDLDAVIARHPDVAMVDELAHTNAPGSRNEKRWQDVEALLDAGINVMSTVNVQHIESLRDVVEQITGALQRETVPDSVLRKADQIEVVDLAPQSLRDRLAEGHVYPANRIDAALSNYFRLGNLTALRELALLWLADEVDTALKAYREEKGIDSKWEARERVVVALTGGPEGETLIRRGARIAARSAGGQLIAVHITSQDGLRDSHPGALATQRALAEKLGGSYHQVVGDDIPHALVDFAKGLNATQLVIGVSRRSRLSAALTGPGTAATVIRESGPIDVHIVNHAAAGGRFALPNLGGALSVRRRIWGAVVAVLGGPLVTAFLFATRSADSIAADVLGFQLLVVLVALIGGLWPALFAAVLSGLTLDYFFVEPIFSITIGSPVHFLALVLYVLNAALVSYVVDQAARRSRASQRAQAESELLATITGSVFRGQDALQALVARTREAFSLSSVQLQVEGETVVSDGDAQDGDKVTSIPAGERGELLLHGGDLQASERRLLSVIAAQADAALEYRELAETAREVGPLAEADRVRSALLAAVGHDLRRPLAAATAAVTGLRSPGITWSDADRDELLATAEESLESLSALVTNLLDVTRLQAGAMAVTSVPVDVAEVVLPALDELGFGPSQVELDLPPDLPPVMADAGLLQRVLVNLVDNAVRFTPEGEHVRLSASAFGGRVEIRVADQGPGVAAERIDEIFVPFQRLGDTDNLTGLGLGLALSKGFTEGMSGTLTAEETPGGGLSMVISLPAVERKARKRS
jgi:two-component system sensor histidine kinase KdpD